MTINKSAQFVSLNSFFILHNSMGFPKCICHVSSILATYRMVSLITLKIPICPHIHLLSLPPTSWQPLIIPLSLESSLFYNVMLLELYNNCSLLLKGWLLSLSYMHLIHFVYFCDLITHLILVTESYPIVGLTIV